MFIFRLRIFYVWLSKPLFVTVFVKMCENNIKLIKIKKSYMKLKRYLLKMIIDQTHVSLSQYILEITIFLQRKNVFLPPPPSTILFFHVFLPPYIIFPMVDTKA